MSLCRRWTGLATALFLGMSTGGPCLAGPGGQALSTDSRAAYHIIVNAENPVTEISRRDVALLFLNSLARWRHGDTSRPVDQSLQSPVREVFSRDVLGMSAGEVRQHWEERLLRKRETPPPAKSGDEDVVLHVSKSKGGIGYVSGSLTLPSAVRAVRITD